MRAANGLDECLLCAAVSKRRIGRGPAPHVVARSADCSCTCKCWIDGCCNASGRSPLEKTAKIGMGVPRLLTVKGFRLTLMFQSFVLFRLLCLRTSVSAVLRFANFAFRSFSSLSGERDFW